MSTLATSLLPVSGQTGVQYQEIAPPIFTNFFFEEDFAVEVQTEFVDEYDNVGDYVGASAAKSVLKLTGTVKVKSGHDAMRTGGAIKAKGVAADWTDDWFIIKAANVTSSIAGRAAKQSVEMWWSTALQTELTATPPTDEDA